MDEPERSEPSEDAPGALPSPRDLDRDMRAVAAAFAVAEREEAAMVLPRRASSAGSTPSRLRAHPSVLLAGMGLTCASATSGQECVADM